MTARTVRTDRYSVRAAGRLAGALNFLCAVPAGFSVFVLRKLVVRSDAPATAANILGSEGLFRMGFVADLVALLIFVAAAVLLYDVFRPAGRRSALFVLVLMSMGAGFQALESIQDLAALTLLEGGAGRGALPSAQASALALVFIRLHLYNYDLALLFFGCSSLVIASLILRSTFLPRVLGPFMMIDGLGYLTFSLATFLSPPLVTRFYPYVPFGTAIGEGVLFLWLIIKSVDVERWREQAAGLMNRPA